MKIFGFDVGEGLRQIVEGASDLKQKAVDTIKEHQGTGASVQSAAAIKQLDEDLKEKPKEEPKALYTETGKTQQEVYEETFGKEVADRKAKAQEEKKRQLLKGQEEKRKSLLDKYK